MGTEAVGDSQNVNGSEVISDKDNGVQDRADFWAGVHVEGS